MIDGLPTEALARIIASEAGTMSRAIKLTVAWIARNRSLLIKRAVLDMAAPQGQHGPITAKRPMSSSQPATGETRAIAAEVLAAPQSQDPTPGATHGFDTALQDSLAVQGIKTNDAAAVMQMSARTLQRRLEGEGTSLTAVVDDTRQALARELLADPALALGEIAYRTGFADLATFSRAFKRWTGTSPGRFRRSLRAGSRPR